MTALHSFSSLDIKIFFEYVSSYAKIHGHLFSFFENYTSEVTIAYVLSTSQIRGTLEYFITVIQPCPRDKLCDTIVTRT